MLEPNFNAINIGMAGAITNYELSSLIADHLLHLYANMGPKNNYSEDFLLDARDIVVAYGFSITDARQIVSRAREMAAGRQRVEKMKLQIMQARLKYEDKILEERLESLR